MSAMVRFYSGLDRVDFEPRSANQVVHLAIELQAPLIRFQYGVDRCCHRETRNSGDRLCSTFFMRWLKPL